jgi:SpoVK/Ycf46/Vps4 family AAA+-type ATPase
LGRPNAEGRRRILEVHTANKPLVDPTIIDRLVPRTKGMVGADLAVLCNRAALNAIRRSVSQVEEGTQALAAAEAALDAGTYVRPETVSEAQERLNKITPVLTDEDFEEALTAIQATRKPRDNDGKERGGLPQPPEL